MADPPRWPRILVAIVAVAVLGLMVFLKLRSTRSGLGLLVAMTGLVLLAVVLHSLLPAQALASRNNQLTILGRGEFLGALFAGLLGALQVTAEIRHGTIRPTLLVTPRRGLVVWAKVWASLLAGAGFGLVAGAVASAAVAASGAFATSHRDVG